MGGIGHIESGAGVALITGMLMSACSFDPSGGAAAAGSGGADASGAASQADARITPTVDAAVTPAAPDAGPLRGTLESRRVTSPPELDGEIDEAWSQVTAVEYGIGDAARTYDVDPSYGWDARVRARSLHDDARIYFLIEVTDGFLVDDSEMPYDDDAIELYLDGAGDRAGPYAADDHWFTIQSTGIYQSFGPSEMALDDGVVATTEAGYTIEVSMERAPIGMTTTANELGFNLGLVDDDDLGTTDADCNGLWFQPDATPCATCCAEQAGPEARCDTTTLGTLALVD